jgi:hypothetical protein
VGGRQDELVEADVRREEILTVAMEPLLLARRGDDRVRLGRGCPPCGEGRDRRLEDEPGLEQVGERLMVAELELAKDTGGASRERRDERARPWVTSSRPICWRTRYASRTEARPTRRSSAMAETVGSRSPGRRVPPRSLALSDSSTDS